MAIYSIGDQARAFALQTASNRLKLSLGTLTDELASGEVSDIGQRLQGNTQVLRAIENQFSAANRFKNNAEEASLRLTGMQDVLGQVQSETSQLGISLISPPFSESVGLLEMRAREVSETFSAVVSRLNGSSAGVFLFSGQNLDQPALIPGDEILGHLSALTVGMTSAADIATAVNDWFEAPSGGGGYLDVAYQGTVNLAQVVPITDAQSLRMTTDASSHSVREVLKGLATAALVDQGVLSGDYQQQRELMQIGGQILLGNDSELLAEMARIGQNQQFSERAKTENAAIMTVMQTARNDIRLADPYETAGALTQIESQLQTLYTVTARLSQLKLSEFLR
ncbi:hypothetical protein PAF17_15025 [Paracoccus sp. Z330]|uniref:Flagellin C-terminal domain-containing protein n=1 Tax=Paracoccus onchidii TaxID=3017813 RepID=A0ABT4ZII6_9RHOB|nr:hypothetical protein [Paracoccus onchidii]MDB6178808.1 hypothetical protein [Paracoccus onchidii]